jgi:hypothetical protein
VGQRIKGILSGLLDMSQQLMVGHNIFHVRPGQKWRLDPELFFFAQIVSFLWLIAIIVTELGGFAQQIGGQQAGEGVVAECDVMRINPGSLAR